MDKEKFDKLLASIDEVTDMMLDELNDVEKGYDEALDTLFKKGFENFKDVVSKYGDSILRLSSTRSMYYTFTKKGSSLEYKFPSNTLIKYRGIPLTIKEQYDRQYPNSEDVLSMKFEIYDSRRTVTFYVGKSKMEYIIPLTTYMTEFERDSSRGPERLHDINRKYMKERRITNTKYVIQFMKILASPDLETLFQTAILGIKKFYLEEIEKAKAEKEAKL